MDGTSEQSVAVTVESDQGSGRAFIIVIDDVQYSGLAQAIATAISQRARSILVRTTPILLGTWQGLAGSFQAMLASRAIRQASFVGIGAGATLVQNLALEAPRVVRSLAIVDASLRPHPSVSERILDTMEAQLPFGLPLRLGSRGFNVRAFAHRLRCPTLLISTRRSSNFVRNELKVLGQSAPTAWYLDVTSGDDAAEASQLCSVLLAFQDTPAKCPQKNLQEAV